MQDYNFFGTIPEKKDLAWENIEGEPIKELRGKRKRKKYEKKR